MVSVSTNASRLWRPHVLDLLDSRRPYRLTVSVYGATAGTYDKLVRRRGAYDKIRLGVDAACAAGLPVSLNLIVTSTNDAEEDAMIAMAEDRGLPHHVFAQMSPTIGGSARSLPA
jgi:MoaA/NifB/PqqE/SkfB family radical SAM enzyme